MAGDGDMFKQIITHKPRYGYLLIKIILLDNYSSFYINKNEI